MCIGLMLDFIKLIFLTTVVMIEPLTVLIGHPRFNNCGVRNIICVDLNGNLVNYVCVYCYKKMEIAIAWEWNCLENG